MKKIFVIIGVIFCLFIFCLGCSGCKKAPLYSYKSAIVKMDNKYFKGKIVAEDYNGGYIVQNEITGEYFIMVCGGYGVTLTPIEVENTENR